MSARSAISILQSAFLFDVIEDDFTLRTIKRGKSVSAQISADDIGANTDISLEHIRKLETELPQKVTVLYANKDIDYQIGSQTILRTAGFSDNNITFELPIVMDDTSASKVCEINMFGAWTEKSSYIFSLPSDFIYLNVGDVLELQYNNLYINIRIVKIVLTSDNIVQCETVKESNYTSNSIGQDSSLGFTSSTLGVQSLTELAILNCPTLDNQLLDTYGVYISACGYSDTWAGCEIFKSKDLGQTYESIGSILEPVYNGKTVSVLGSGPTTIWDLTNSVEISIASGSLEQSTMENILEGKQYAIIGNEIIQFVDVEVDVIRGTFILSKLLRGRRGTEWAIGTHAKNEIFSLLSYDMTYDFSTLNVERYYKGVTLTKYLDEAEEITKTYTGVNLIPLTPANVHIVTTDFSDTITWKRRDRYVSGYFRSLPLSENTEAFVLKIYNYLDELVRTYELTNEYIVEYTAADKLADGIILGESIKYEIYQVGTNSDGYITEELIVYDETYINWLLNNATYFFRFDEPIDSTIAYDSITGTRTLLTTIDTDFEQVSSLPNSSNTSIKTNNSNMSGYLPIDANTFVYTCCINIDLSRTENICTILNIGYQLGIALDVVNLKIKRTDINTLWIGNSAWGNNVGAEYDITNYIDGWIYLTIISKGTYIKVYINGIFSNSTGGTSNTMHYATIGGTPVGGTKSYDVAVDEYILFDKTELDDIQILNLYEMSQKETQ